MSIPSFSHLLQPTLTALHDLGGIAAIKAIDEHVLRGLDLPPEDFVQPHSGKNMTELEYRLHWARTYLKHYGLIINAKRGLWTLTERGQTVNQIDPREVMTFVHELKKKAKTPSGPSERSAFLETSADLTGATASTAAPALPADLSHSLTPHLPTNTSVRYFIAIMDGVSKSLFHDMVGELWAQRGNPQEQVEWADPDQWIPERLEGTEQALALRLWRDSKHTVNPRFARGPWTLATRHGLIVKANDVLHLTERGRQFIAEFAGPVVAEIDEAEGTLIVLRLVAEKGPGWRGEFLPQFADYCRASTTLHSDNGIKSYLYNRLSNLVERTYVLRRGLTYEITDAGLTYLAANAVLLPGPTVVASLRSDIHKLAKDLRQEAREQLADHLAHMNPFKFEELIKLLLEEMGYDDVETTTPTNDKGVDVVANIELGISSVREVIQVKRHKGSLNRTVLDQLRGSLHRFNAVRGTVISTGKFSKGALEAAFERGAAPITLIDGDKLLDLLMERQIGVAKKAVEYYEFDPAKLAQFETEASVNGSA